MFPRITYLRGTQLSSLQKTLVSYPVDLYSMLVQFHFAFDTGLNRIWLVFDVANDC